MGAAKGIYHSFKAIAIVISVITLLSTGLIVSDASRINVVPPNGGNVIVTGLPTWLNITFPVTIGYDGSVFTFKDINLTVAVYPSTDGVGTPLAVNTTFITMDPHSVSKTMNYNFSIPSPPPLTHLSIRATANGFIALGDIAFMGFGLSLLYTVF